MRNINPLLVVLKRHDLLIKCGRVYTTVYQDGSCRVKFYGAELAGDTAVNTRAKLRALGYTDVSIESVEATALSYQGTTSVVVKASGFRKATRPCAPHFLTGE